MTAGAPPFAPADARPITPPGALSPSPPPPLALYVHLPWCVSKCPYCDFNSHKAPAAMPEDDYIAAVLRDLESVLPRVWGRRLCAMFIGGGTPSLFSPAAIDRLVTAARALFNPPPDMEITLEANPESADAAKLQEFRAAGINRLSLGAQSFCDSALAALKRAHNGACARAAADAACRVFDNVNIDLMHALPAQTAADAAADVRAAAGYAPAHLSLYQLTMEAGTPFFRAPPPALPDDDAAADIAAAVADAAAAAGYARYEISAYARPRRQCRHNLNYWRFGDYIGVGAGAHAKICEGGRIYRETRVKNPKSYMRAKSPLAARWQVRGDDAVFEFLLNALRLDDGFDPAEMRRRAGAPSPRQQRNLARAEADGLLQRDGGRVRTTATGRRFLNELLQRFL